MRESMDREGSSPACAAESAGEGNAGCEDGDEAGVGAADLEGAAAGAGAVMASGILFVFLVSFSGLEVVFQAGSDGRRFRVFFFNESKKDGFKHFRARHQRASVVRRALATAHHF